jgi:hypothetical protein
MDYDLLRRRISRLPPIYYFAITASAFLLFFILLYIAVNPLNITASSINYPYSLSIRPDLIGGSQSANISFSSNDNKTPSQDLSPVVIDPSSTIIKLKAQIKKPFKGKTLTYTFPQQFNLNKSSLDTGNYSAILTSNKDNSIIIKSHFLVVNDPILYSLGIFAFKEGLPLSIGLMIAVITTAYQFASASSNDFNHKRQDKTNWMISNSKYYLSLSAQSRKICECFDPPKLKEPKGFIVNFPKNNLDNLLFLMIKFYQAYNNYENKVGISYFDHVPAENFIWRLRQDITRLYNEIFDHWEYKIYDNKEKPELIKLESFKDHKKELDKWLNDQTEKGESYEDIKLTNKQILYLYNFVYWWTLFICINDEARINYSSTKQLRNDIFLRIRKNESETGMNVSVLEYGINYFNTKYYHEYYHKHKKNYYVLLFNNKNLIEEIKKSNIL